MAFNYILLSMNFENVDDKKQKIRHMKLFFFENSTRIWVKLICQHATELFHVDIIVLHIENQVVSREKFFVSTTRFFLPEVPVSIFWEMEFSQKNFK